MKREQTREGQTIMSVRASIEDYFKDIVRRFEQRMQVKVKDAETPWLDSGAEKRYAKELEQPGLYGWMAACRFPRLKF